MRLTTWNRAGRALKNSFDSLAALFGKSDVLYHKKKMVPCRARETA